MSDSKGYDLPDVDSVATPEQAAQAINRVFADAMGDSNHPYMNGNHPQHGDFLRTVAKLHEIRTQDADERTPLEKGLSAALDYQQEQQEARVAEAAGVMVELVERGYRDDTIPGDVTRYEVDLLRLQLAAAKGEWETVLPKLRDDLQKFQAPGAMMETLVAVQNLPGHLTDFKLQLTEQLLFWLRDAKRTKFGRLNVS
ncbi:MAG TPA: hypothetical protein VJJ98_03800 [Sedimentisphaerales bacterium]|nr:hypothetical protein [Sedimentisphaerales bacterium]